MYPRESSIDCQIILDSFAYVREQPNDTDDYGNTLAMFEFSTGIPIIFFYTYSGFTH